MRHNRHNYVALNGQWVDEEKLAQDDTSSVSSWSSREASHATEGLLSNDHDRARRPHHRSLAYKRQRRRFSRYFTAILGGVVLATVIYLVHLSATSEARLRFTLKKTSPPTWENFPFLTKYHGGIGTLVSRAENKPEWPDKAHEAEIGEKRNDTIDARDVRPSSVLYKPRHGQHLEPTCFLDAEGKIPAPSLRMYPGVPQGMPDPAFGSYDVLGLDYSGCFDRYGRLGMYGLGYSVKYGGTGAGVEGEGREEAMREIWGDNLELDYSTIRWAEAQSRCAKSATATSTLLRNDSFIQLQHTGPTSKESEDSEDSPLSRRAEQAAASRTAVLIRTWHDYEYDAEDILFLRSLISELSLQSAGRYEVHFLIHVKDENLAIWSDPETHQRVLNASLPTEFQGMGTLWSERQMYLVYGGLEETLARGLGVYGVYRSTFMPVQYFAEQHPDFDFFWNVEMDVRYTGHWLDLLDKTSEWSKEQPRKGLWERNGRFYVPSEHGSWEEFSHMVRVQTEHGAGNKGGVSHNADPGKVSLRAEAPVWGPLRPVEESDHFETDPDMQPPTSYTDDKHTWGKGEDADLITFSPLFDPDQTTWLLADDHTGYNTSSGAPPRRASSITFSRLSRRLLHTMHRETALAHHSMFSEMFPATMALHHGYKAVYVPHPVYIDRRWPTSYLAAMFNNGRNGATGGARSSVFSEERQHNFKGTTWFYNAGFPENLWRRWLGYKVDGDGGEEAEKAGEGRMCLPPMLLHPVKQVDMVYEE